MEPPRRPTGSATSCAAATKKLRASIGDLRGSLAEIRSLASGASSDADSAAAQIGAVVNDLSVLEDRFNFHLRSHGG